MCIARSLAHQGLRSASGVDFLNRTILHIIFIFKLQSKEKLRHSVVTLYKNGTGPAAGGIPFDLTGSH